MTTDPNPLTELPGAFPDLDASRVDINQGETNA
jgi:hypothetical protein